MMTNGEYQKIRIGAPENGTPDTLIGMIAYSIQKYSEEQGTTFDCAVRDALIEMRHICDAFELDYAERDKQAYAGYVEECQWRIDEQEEQGLLVSA